MKSRLLAAAIAMTAPLAAHAGDSGLELAFRTGFALPLGDVGGVSGSPPASLSDSFHAFLPLGVEAGYRFTPNVYAGLVFDYAFGFPNNCPSGASCSGHDVGLGFDVRYHTLPGEPVDPWFGIGAGYEWLSLAQTQGGSSADAGANGFEFVHVDFGADFLTSPNLRLGSFLQFKLGQYRTVDGSSGGSSFSTEIPNKALHEFLTVGFRISFLL